MASVDFAEELQSQLDRVTDTHERSIVDVDVIQRVLSIKDAQLQAQATQLQTLQFDLQTATTDAARYG